MKGGQGQEMETTYCVLCQQKKSIFKVIGIDTQDGELTFCFECLDKLSEDEVCKKLEELEKIKNGHENFCKDSTARLLSLQKGENGFD